MRLITDESALTVGKNFELSPADLRLLSCGYLPILGAEAFSLYLTLCYDWNFGKNGGFRFGKDLFSASGLSQEKVQEARRRLEATDLLHTYYKENKDGASFVLKLLPPRRFEDFFSDPVFSSLLSNRVGGKRNDLLRGLFADQILPTDGFVDVSETPDSVFPSDTISSVIPADTRFKNEEKSKANILKTSLDHELSTFGMSVKVLGSDADEVLSLGIFYACDAKTLARAVADSTSSDNIFAIERFRQLLTDRMTYARTLDDDQGKSDSFFGNSVAAKQFAAMDEISVPEFIARVLNLSKAPKTLLDTVGQIQDDYGFSNGVINALISFVVQKTHSVPNEKYIEKVALSLAPLHPGNAYQAALILKEGQSQMKERKKRAGKAREALKAKAKEMLENGEKEKATESAEKTEKVAEEEDESASALDALKKSMGM